MTRSNSIDYDRVYRQTHRKEINAYRKKAKVKKKTREYNKIYRQRPEVRKQQKERMFKWGLKFNYGITPEAFHSMLAKQGGVCAICGKAEWGRKTPYIDHDHGSKKNIRGILCVRCNTALGMIRDNIETAKSMVVYLEKALPDKENEKK